MLITLKELRKNRGLSQAYVAHRLGISRNHFCNIENHKRSLSAHMALTLEYVYKLPTRDIVRIYEHGRF